MAKYISIFFCGSNTRFKGNISISLQQGTIIHLREIYPSKLWAAALVRWLPAVHKISEKYVKYKLVLTYQSPKPQEFYYQSEDKGSGRLLDSFAGTERLLSFQCKQN